MATALEPTRATHDQEDDLSDEQIEQLLARATARLQEKSKDKQLTKKNEQQHLSFPKLDAGNLEKPYVTTNGDIATIDSSRLLEEKHRKKAEGFRKVEDPIISKKAAEEVRAPTRNLSYTAMRKIIPTPKRLMRRPQSVLGCAALVRAFIFIVTLSIHTIIISIFQKRRCYQLHSLTSRFYRTRLPPDPIGSTFPRPS